MSTTTHPTNPPFAISQAQLPSFYATVFKLTALKDGHLPGTQGRLAQAAFLDIIRSVDPSLAEALHTPNQRRPYTLSPVMDLPRPKGNQIPIKRGKQVWLRATLLDTALFGSLTQHLLSMKNEALKIKHGNNGANWVLPALQLGRVTFAISEMLTTPGSHPWAGYTTMARLVQHWEDVPLDKSAWRIEMDFASPTVFSLGSREGLGKMMEILPYPAMFFGSMAARWNGLMPVPFDDEAIRDYAEATIVVGRYNLRSQPAHFWKNPQMGFMGQITYLLKDKTDVAMIRTLNLLADFAFYSGVGAKTAMGMGLTKCVRREA